SRYVPSVAETRGYSVSLGIPAKRWTRRAGAPARERRTNVCCPRLARASRPPTGERQEIDPLRRLGLGDREVGGGELDEIRVLRGDARAHEERETRERPAHEALREKLAQAERIEA